MTEQEHWDQVILDVGKRCGQVAVWDDQIRIYLSKEASQVTVPQSTFDRLVRERRIDVDGKVLS